MARSNGLGLKGEMAPVGQGDLAGTGILPVSHERVKWAARGTLGVVDADPWSPFG